MKTGSSTHPSSLSLEPLVAVATECDCARAGCPLLLITDPASLVSWGCTTAVPSPLPAPELSVSSLSPIMKKVAYHATEFGVYLHTC